MPQNMTLQTSAAIERIYDALVGKTADDLEALTLHLKELLRKANEIAEISAEINE
jgi:hypothetical protein